MSAFFVRLFQHELVESRQGHIITVEVIGLLNKNRTHYIKPVKKKERKIKKRILNLYHGHVHVACVQLEVDLLVDASLAFFVVVLTAQRHFDRFKCKNR